MVVYKITNKINNKCYIGSTKHFNQRMREHINYAHYKWHQSYNFPLQRAFRKYGIENFTFEIIEDNIPLEKISQKEQQYIVQYNSLCDQHGYNQTLYTDCALRDPSAIQALIERTGKKCAWVDSKMNIIKTYSSLHEAARSLGLKEASCVRVVCLGEQHSIHNKIFRFLDEENKVINYGFKTRKYKKGIIGFSIYNKDDIVIYESISEAARQENISRQSISKCLNGQQKYTHVGERVWREYYEDRIVENELNINDIIYKHSGYCSINYKTGEQINFYSLAEIQRLTKHSSITIHNRINKNIIKNDIGYYKLDIYGNPIMKGSDIK